MAARTKAAKTTARKAGKAAAGARANPYVQRFIEDPELRDNVRAAVDHARQAYKRLSNGKGPAKALMEDRKLHKELRKTADSLKEAGEQLRGKRAQAPRAQAVDARRARRGSVPDRQRGGPQGAARQDLRRRGGVRVHLDDARPRLHCNEDDAFEGAQRAPSARSGHV